VSLIRSATTTVFVQDGTQRLDAAGDSGDIIYCIDMMQRCSTNQRPRPNGRGGGEELFDVLKLGPNSGRSMRQNGAVFHKIYDNDQAVTVQVVKMKIFIEQANTGGESPLVIFFMFLVVEVPLTFNFVDTVYRSCTKNTMGREKFICNDMKRIWVNIAHRHQTFSGSGKTILEAMLQIQFNITSRSKISVQLANLLINIRFNSINMVLDGNCPSLVTDAVFVGISDMCCAVFCQELETCKQRVKQYKAAKRRKGRGPDNGGDAGADEEEEDEAEMEMPVFEPPVIMSLPTYVDWDDEETRDLFVQLTLPGMLEQPAEMQCMLLEHIKKHPSTVKIEGFPITNSMVAYVDTTMLLPHCGALL